MKNWPKIKVYNTIVSMKLEFPKEIEEIALKLNKAGFEAYLVGGCVRDLILNRKPKDWDLTTNALPQQIIELFPKTFYENNFGTVGVVNESENVSDETLKIVEITPFREEGNYSDFRRPDDVKFGSTLDVDLQRRDFTINAIALDPIKNEIHDLFEGQKDIKDKILRAVGDPDKRFKEDGLRMLRAVRISTELGFTIDKKTQEAIKNDADLLKNISEERVRDEFSLILMSDKPEKGLILSHELGILKFILPELEASIGIDQNKAHSFDVWTHLLKSLQHSANKNMTFHVRLAALFHDIAKPDTRRWSEEKKDWTFYGHEVVGARKTEKILQNLKFSRETIEKVIKLVRWHMFFSDTEQISLSAVRRIVSKVGKENIWELMDVRSCDRIGTGRPKESPYRLRKYHSMIDEVMADPISVSMLKINGNDLIKSAKIDPGPRIGYILHALLEEVLDDPNRNTEDYLLKKSLELLELTENELKMIGEAGKEKKEEKKEEIVEDIRKKHWVK